MTEYIPKLSICGFSNMGNTCYMNSILQLLIHCKILINFVIKKENENEENEESTSDYEKYLYQGAIERIAEHKRKKLNIDQNEQISIKRSEIDEFMNSSIINKLSEIINTIIDKGNSNITPTSFKQIIDKKFPYFIGYQQHDAHELLIYIIDAIIEETGIESEPSYNNISDDIISYLKIKDAIKIRLENEPDIHNKRMIIKYLNEYKKQNYDTIYKYEGIKYMLNVFKNRYNPFILQIKLFLINQIVCTNCQNISHNFENTTILKIPIASTLGDCFTELIKEEIIDYKCETCNENCKAIKSCKIWKNPLIMFVQLNRFINFPDGRIKKNNTNVEIPHILNIDNYCDKSLLDNKNTLVYKLKGISNHHGGMNGGHYTADCCCIINDSWYHFDDSSVSKYKTDNIDTSSAYILMYELQ